MQDVLDAPAAEAADTDSLAKRADVFEGRNGLILAGTLTAVLTCFLIFIAILLLLYLRRRRKLWKTRRIRVASSSSGPASEEPAQLRAPTMQQASPRGESILISHNIIGSPITHHVLEEPPRFRRLPTPRIPSPLSFPGLSRKTPSPGPQQALGFGMPSHTTTSTQQHIQKQHQQHPSLAASAISVTPSSVSPFTDPDPSSLPIPDSSVIQHAMANHRPSTSLSSSTYSTSKRTSKHLPSFSYPTQHTRDKSTATMASTFSALSSVSTQHKPVVFDSPPRSSPISTSTFTPSSPYFGKLVMSGGAAKRKEEDVREDLQQDPASEGKRKRASGVLPSVLFTKRPPTLERAKSSSRMDHLSTLGSVSPHPGSVLLHRSISDSAYSSESATQSQEFGLAV